MSYFVEIVIACDAPSCQRFWATSRRNAGGLSKTRAGYLARQDGWDIPGSPGGPGDPRLAYCPVHHREPALRRTQQGL